MNYKTFDEVRNEKGEKIVFKIELTIENLEKYFNLLDDLIKGTFHEKLLKQIDELEQIIKAQESVVELSRNERIDKDRVIKAYEALNEFVRKESIYNNRIIQAHESIAELYKLEIIDRDKSIQAYQTVEELVKLEIRFYHQVMGAYENVLEMSRNEQMEKDNTITKLNEIIKQLKDKTDNS